MNKWQSVNRVVVRFTMNIKWFKQQGLIFLEDFIKKPLELPLFQLLIEERLTWPVRAVLSGGDGRFRPSPTRIHAT